MATPSMQELIDRLEKLEIASTAPSTIPQRKEFGPYDPPVPPPTLKATISEICQQDEVDQEQFPKRGNPKLPQIDLPKFSGTDFPTFVEKFARFLRLSGLNFAFDLVKTDWLAQACEPGVYKITTNVIKETGSELTRAIATRGCAKCSCWFSSSYNT